MRLPWYICESVDRWETALRSFAANLCSSPDDDLFVSAFDDPNRCRSGVEKESRAIVLWELPEANATPVLESIAHLATRRHDVLQFVALATDAGASPPLRINLELALREIGVTNVLTDPLDLARQASLVQNFWQMGRDGGNLSTVHDIWDRLPWAESS